MAPSLSTNASPSQQQELPPPSPSSVANSNSPEEQQRTSPPLRRLSSLNRPPLALSSPNIVRPCGTTSSSCGYCHGSRAKPSFSSLSESSGSDGYSSGSTGGGVGGGRKAKTYGSIFDRICPEDYNRLIDAGWRRSGRYLYLPDNTASCCPQYTIRLKASDFRKNRDQRRVWRKMERYLAGEIGEGGMLSHQQQQHGQLHKNNYLVEELERLERWIADIAGNVVSRNFETVEGLSKERLLAASKLKVWRGGKGSSSKNTEDTIKNSKNTSTEKVCYVSSIARAASGMSRGFVESVSLAKSIVEEMHRAAELVSSTKVVLREMTADCAGFVTLYLEVTSSCINTPALGEVLSPALAKRGILTVRSVPSHISSKMPEVHALYAKYQHKVHGDSDPFAEENSMADKNEEEDDNGEDGDKGGDMSMDCIVSSNQNNGGRIDEDDGKRRRMEARMERIRRSKEAFDRFLCDAPFPLEVKDCDCEEDENNWKSSGNFSVDEEGYDVHIPHGSYHQQYRVDGALVAVGVVDILPHCLSSVYAFYDPDLSRKLALGKYTALREIEWVRRASLEPMRPELCFYYLGYYIHSCPKMRYKADYEPSHLRCPVSGNWIPFQEAKPRIEAAGPRHYTALAFTMEGRGVDKDDGAQLCDDEGGGYSDGGRQSSTFSSAPSKKYRTSEQGFSTGPSRSLSSAAPSSSNNVIAGWKGDRAIYGLMTGSVAEMMELTRFKSTVENIRLDIGIDMDGYVTLANLNTQGRRIVKPIVDEFVESVGIEMSQRCVLKLT